MLLCIQVGTPSKASWHPAATGHRLVGEILAANYLQVFKRAVVEMDSASPGITLQHLQVIQHFAQNFYDEHVPVVFCRSICRIC
jgi:hypothetical protein